MGPDTSESGYCGLHRPVTIVADEHAMIDGLLLVHGAALDDLL